MREKLLIHTCCAPCLCFPHSVLEKDYSLIGFWFNPNIHPFSEYQKRLNTLYAYQVKTGIEIIYNDEYLLKEWLLKTKSGWENNDKDLRCKLCYRMRLERTAEVALEHNIKIFTTTLLYSKFQLHDEVRKIGEEISQKYKIRFLYMDLRDGWKEGIKISHRLGLYRQHYCGCIFSEVYR